MTRQATPALDALPNLLTVPQAAEVLSIAKSTLYDQIRRDQFPHVKIGERVYVSQAQIAQLLGVKQAPPLAANGTNDTVTVAALLKLVRGLTQAPMSAGGGHAREGRQRH